MTLTVFTFGYGRGGGGGGIKVVPFFPVQLFRAGFGLTVRRWAGSSMQKDFSSIPVQTSCVLIFFVVCGYCLMTLSLTINETLERLSSLPILMLE